MKIEELHSLFLKYPKICTDSRMAGKGSLFFALKGENFNGNKFADNALLSGCEKAIVDESEYAQDERFILVDDVLKTLQELAFFHRTYLKIPIIGITGTNGKTTTKELINCVLASHMSVCCTKGNLNNHIGVPLTLLSMTKQHDIGIVEMGANHLNEISELCNISDPDYGIITNIGKAHLEGFGSFEGVKKTKKELYDYIGKKSGTIFYNADDNILSSILPTVQTCSYAIKANATVQGTVIDSSIMVALSITLDSGDTFKIFSHLFGNYNAFNILAAVAFGVQFNIPHKKIIQSIERYTPDNNRSQLIKTNSNTLFLDAYNANPSSMRASVENFINLKIENKVLILGEMYELGKDHVAEHSKIVAFLKSQNNIEIILVGNWGKNIIDGSFLCFKDSTEVIDYLKENKISKSNVLIKGSRGVKLETIVDYL